MENIQISTLEEVKALVHLAYVESHSEITEFRGKMKQRIMFVVKDSLLDSEIRRFNEAGFVVSHISAQRKGHLVISLTKVLNPETEELKALV